MIITIDGPAGGGKSTAAKYLADKLNFIHFNNGNIFRAITAFLHENNFEIESINVKSNIPKLDLNVEMINGVQHTFVNNVDYTPIVRDNAISVLVPKVSLNEQVQQTAQNFLRKFSSSNNIVIEGRGLGSSILPNADIKFYLDCSIKERAKRRFLEEKSKNSKISLKTIETQLEERDLLDKTRKINPLVIPENSIYIDTTSMNEKQVLEEMLKHINIK